MPGSDRVKPATPGVKLTYDDFVLFPEDGKRHELIDGEHYVTPSPNTRHQQISGNIYWLIRSYLEQHPIGRLLYAPYDIVFSQFDVVEPDLLYLSHARAAEVITDTHGRGAPELVVEIASEGTRKRDETIKRRLYERGGVSEYWIVDPEIETVRIFQRGPEGYARAMELSREAGDLLTTPLLPGLELRVADVFKD